MDRPVAPQHCLSRRRAACKAVVVFIIAAVIIAALSRLISERDLETLKHSLSLWTLIALVVIINVVSFACFIVMFAAWQWIRRDLKPPRDDGLDE